MGCRIRVANFPARPLCSRPSLTHVRNGPRDNVKCCPTGLWLLRSSGQVRRAPVVYVFVCEGAAGRQGLQKQFVGIVMLRWRTLKTCYRCDKHTLKWPILSEVCQNAVARHLRSPIAFDDSDNAPRGQSNRRFSAHLLRLQNLALSESFLVTALFLGRICIVVSESRCSNPP